jgi:hypothetical protein
VKAHGISGVGLLGLLCMLAAVLVAQDLGFPYWCMGMEANNPIANTARLGGRESCVTRTPLQHLKRPCAYARYYVL